MEAHRLPAVAAAFAPFPEETDSRLRGALAARGIEQLYTHQAEAFEHVLAGRNVVTITPTASGKTLCYNAPVLSTMLRDPSARALYLFPTKALAQDQLAELHVLAERLAEHAGAEIGVFTYDGDTPQDARRAIRGRGHVVLSNPDMLHSGILPHHPRWAKLLENLRYVVIDDAGRVVLTGVVAPADDSTFLVNLSGRLAPGRYVMNALIAVSGNVMNADIRRIPVAVSPNPSD